MSMCRWDGMMVHTSTHPLLINDTLHLYYQVKHKSRRFWKRLHDNPSFEFTKTGSGQTCKVRKLKRGAAVS